MLASVGERFDKFVKEGLTFIERPDWQTFVATMRAFVISVQEESLHTVGGDSGGPQVAAVGAAKGHFGNSDHTRPHEVGDAIQSSHDLRIHRRSRTPVLTI